MSQKKCILVLGIHRSGTSAITGCLQQYLGVNLGKLLMAAVESNPKGHFENLALYKLHEYILNNNKFVWSDFVTDIKYSDSDLDVIKTTLLNEFDDASLIAIKDPRMIYLFPLYERALNDLGYEINILIPYRNPIEVAASLIKREGGSEYKWLFLWAYNFLLTERYSRQYKKAFIKFDDLLIKPAEQMLRIAKTFNIQTNTLQNFQDNGFVDIKLKHHNLNTTKLSEYPNLQLDRIVRLIDQIGSQEQLDAFDEMFSFYVEYIRQLKMLGLNNCNYHNDVLQQLLNEKNNQLQTKDQQIQHVNNQLQTKDQQIQHVNNQLQTKDQQMQHVNNQLQAKDQQMQHVNNQLQDKNNQLLLMYNSISWKITKPLRLLRKIQKTIASQ